MNNRLIKPLLLVAVVLVLPLVAVAIWGQSFQAVLEQWQASPPATPVLAAAVVAILASDLFLPVPSGPVSTLAGSQLGLVLGTVVSTVGMTIGASVAFALARRWGRPVAEHFSAPDQVAELEASCGQHGALGDLAQENRIGRLVQRFQRNPVGPAATVSLIGSIRPIAGGRPRPTGCPGAGLGVY